MFIRLRRVGVTDFLIWLSWLLLMRNSSKLGILVRSVHVHWQLIHLRKHLLVVRMLTSISLCGNLHSHVRHGLVHSLVVYLNKGPLAHVLSTETSGVTHSMMRWRRIFLDSLLGFWALPSCWGEKMPSSQRVSICWLAFWVRPYLLVVWVAFPSAPPLDI